MDEQEKVEILAPAGSYESLQAAINAGCDAIYFGITQLNMRAASTNNFGFKDLKLVADTCHKSNVKCYLTVNTLLYQHDLLLSHKIIDAVKESGVDAIIASDMAAIMYAKSVGVEVHLSTQMSISNLDTIKFYSQVSDRIVLARELNLKMIKDICTGIKEQNIRGPKGNLIEIEVFVHGAMCVAVSGRCSMSLFTDNSSANRGACKQNCRRAYTVTDDAGNQLKIDNEFVMSPEDLCTIELIDQVVNSGVKVLKIEGRGRAPEYVDTVVRCYREAVDSVYDGTYSKEKVSNWMERLHKVYNRGLGTGFYLGKQMNEWSSAYGSKATEEKTYIGEIEKFYVKPSVAEISIMAESINDGEEFYIIGPTTGVMRGKIQNMLIDDVKAEKAVKGNVITLKVENRVRKGDKLYVVRSTSQVKDSVKFEEKA